MLPKKTPASNFFKSLSFQNTNARFCGLLIKHADSKW